MTSLSPIKPAALLLRTLRHLFPKFSDWLSELPDLRDQSKILYDPSHLLWSGIFIFLLKLESRRQLRYEADGPEFLRNLLLFSGSSEERVADPDTLDHYLKKLPQERLSGLTARMTGELIRRKALDPFRLKGYFLVAVDGSGMMTFEHKHCANCLSRKLENGKILYFHHVLEAKLVTANGFAFSIATEFIENPSGKYDKQDCELRAFKRLQKTLKSRFPRTPICLLLDALYAGKPVFDICLANQWKFLITFKEGSMKAVWADAQSLLGFSPGNRKTAVRKKKRQVFRWLNSLSCSGHELSAIFCDESGDDGVVHPFAWLTNFEVSGHNVETLANDGGRLRWKIENEGFNVQKNGGYAMEHTFSTELNAAKNYYHLLQIAHMFDQLLDKGSLFKNLRKRFGSLKNFARRLSEDLRCFHLPKIDFLPPVGQIRFSSS